ADIGLEGRLAVQRIIDNAQGRWQVLEAAEFAIKRCAKTFYAHVVAERGGCQQLDTNLVGQHIGEVQTQLGVAVQCGCAGSCCSADFDSAAIFTRINSNRTSADDNVPRLVGLGQGSGESCGQQGSGKQGLAHSVKLHPDMGALRWGNGRARCTVAFDPAQ